VGTFNPSSSTGGGGAFVPKKKQTVTMGGSFPILGQPPSEKDKGKDEHADDPCRGKSKEFFVYKYDAK
jgi:hypothetical protein